MKAPLRPGFRFACACAALSVLALALGARFAARAASARASLEAFQAEGAATLGPALAEEEAWRAALAAFPPARGGVLPPEFSGPECGKTASDVRFREGAGGFVREESFVFRRISPADLSRALDGARAAGFKPAAFSADALPGGSVKAGTTLVSIEPGQAWDSK